MNYRAYTRFDCGFQIVYSGYTYMYINLSFCHINKRTKNKCFAGLGIKTIIRTMLCLSKDMHLSITFLLVVASFSECFLTLCVFFEIIF